MMNRNGYLPKHNCKQCQNPLSETERYLGIYTGLCTNCMNMPAYIVSCYKIDNCLIISHPPNSPSHRRDRSEHHAYIDCFVCKGTGHIYQSRSFTSGGGFYAYCEVCLLERFYKHIARIAYEADIQKIENTQIVPFKLALDKQFSKVVLAELKEKDYSKYTEEDKIKWASLAESFLKQYKDFRDKVLYLPNKLYGNAYEFITYKPGVILLSNY